MSAMPKSLLSFCLGATYDTMPSVYAHNILGACNVLPLEQGRFTYCDDSVLQAFWRPYTAFIPTQLVRVYDDTSYVKPGTKI